MNVTIKLLYLFFFVSLLVFAGGCKKKTQDQPAPVVVPPVTVIDTPNNVPDLPFDAWNPKTLSQKPSA